MEGDGGKRTGEGGGPCTVRESIQCATEASDSYDEHYEGKVFAFYMVKVFACYIVKAPNDFDG